MPTGIPFEPSEADIIDVLIEKRGNLAATAKKFGIHRQTINDYLNERPHLWDHVHKARDIRDLDAAQRAVDGLLWFAEQRETKPRLALQAIIQVLDRKGDLLKWHKKNESGETLKDTLLREYLADVTKNNPRLPRDSGPKVASE